jgi:hypothetical protein
MNSSMGGIWRRVIIHRGPRGSSSDTYGFSNAGLCRGVASRSRGRPVGVLVRCRAMALGASGGPQGRPVAAEMANGESRTVKPDDRLAGRAVIWPEDAGDRWKVDARPSIAAREAVETRNAPRPPSPGSPSGGGRSIRARSAEIASSPTLFMLSCTNTVMRRHPPSAVDRR